MDKKYLRRLVELTSWEDIVFELRSLGPTSHLFGIIEPTIFSWRTYFNLRIHMGEEPYPITEKAKGLFTRWNVYKNRWVWGTFTRDFSIRIVGPLSQKATGKFYYTAHKRDGSVKIASYSDSLLNAKKTVIATVLDIRPNLKWRDLVKALMVHRKELSDDAAIAAIAGEEFESNGI